MISELIIRDVNRDLQGLENVIACAAQAPSTTLPEHFYISAGKGNALKHKMLLTSLLVSTLASASPDFKEIKFGNQEQKNVIEIYHCHVDSLLNSSLQEYKLIFERSFSMESFLNEVLSFKGLKNNWDGYGAIPTEIKCASQAISLASKLSEKLIARISEVFPNPNGTVTVEWENHSHERLVAEIGNSSFSYYLKLNSLSPKFYNNVQVSDEGIHELSTNIKKLFI
jgi:hypothetical protein